VYICIFCGIGFSYIRRGWLLSVRFLMFWYLLFCVSHCITIWICSYSCCVVVFVVCVFPVSRRGTVSFNAAGMNKLKKIYKYVSYCRNHLHLGLGSGIFSFSYPNFLHYRACYLSANYVLLSVCVCVCVCTYSLPLLRIGRPPHL